MIAPLPDGDGCLFQDDTQHRYGTGAHIAAGCGGNFRLARADAGQQSVTVHRSHNGVFGTPCHRGRRIGFWFHRGIELKFAARCNFCAGGRYGHTGRVLRRYRHLTGGNSDQFVPLCCHLNGNFLVLRVGGRHINGGYRGFQRVSRGRNRHFVIPIVLHGPFHRHTDGQCIAAYGIG